MSELEPFPSEMHRIRNETCRIINRHAEALDACVRDLRDAGLLKIGEYGVNYTLMLKTSTGEELGATRFLPPADLDRCGFAAE